MDNDSRNDPSEKVTAEFTATFLGTKAAWQKLGRRLELACYSMGALGAMAIVAAVFFGMTTK